MPGPPNVSLYKQKEDPAIVSVCAGAGSIVLIFPRKKIRTSRPNTDYCDAGTSEYFSVQTERRSRHRVSLRWGGKYCVQIFAGILVTQVQVFVRTFERTEQRGPTAVKPSKEFDEL